MPELCNTDSKAAAMFSSSFRAGIRTEQQTVVPLVLGSRE
jgi:hypothetical protein